MVFQESARPPRPIVTNAVANSAGFFVSVGITLFLTPFVISSLGEVRYGVWALVMSVTGYYGILDVGLRGGLSQYLTRYLAQGRMAEFNRTASTGVVALSVAGLVLLLISVVVARHFNQVISVPAHLHNEVRWTLLTVGSGVSLQFPFFMFSTVFIATERYDISNVISIAANVMRAATIVLVLKAGQGLVGLAAGTFCVLLLEYVVRAWVCYRLVPGMRVSPSLSSIGSLREFGVFGLWNSLNQLAYRVLIYSPTLIVGVFISPSAVAVFAVAASLNMYFVDAFAPITQVFYPVITRLDSQGALGALSRLYLRGYRAVLGLTMLASFLAYFWVEAFLRMWIGDSFQNEFAYQTIATTYRILMVAGFATAVGSLAGHVLVGTRRIRPFALAVVTEAFVNVVVTIFAVRSYGIAGAAVAAAVAAVLFRLIIIPYMCYRILNISWQRMLHESVRPMIAVGLFAGASLAARPWLPSCGTWLGFAAQVTASGALGSTFLLALGTTASERREISFRVSQTIARVVAIGSG